MTPEIRELTSTLDRHRELLLKTAEGLTDEQARTTSTVSVLTIASLLKHVADTEEDWLHWALHGTMRSEVYAADIDWDAVASGADAGSDPRFVLSDDDTLDRLRERVLEVGRATTHILETTDPNLSHPLPEAPWFEAGEAWSVRRVALHMLAEIAQHAGHADIIRESIDGAKSMG